MDKKISLKLQTSFLSYRPSQFDRYLEEKIEAYRNLRDRYKKPLAAWLWAMFRNTIPHRSGIESVSPIHHAVKKKIFGSAKEFEEVNALLGWFELKVQPRKGVYAGGWALTKSAEELVDSFLEFFFNRSDDLHVKDPLKLVDSAGKPYRFSTRAIKSLTHTGIKCRFPLDIVDSRIAINEKSILELHNSVRDVVVLKRSSLSDDFFTKWNIQPDQLAYDKLISKLTLAKSQIEIILSLSLKKDYRRFLYTYYMESRSGRLYALGHTNLQRCVRQVRKAALAGCYDIDVENCHWSLLYQMSLREGIFPSTIKYYLENKKEVRSYIASDCGISHEDSKFLLISIIYGASLNPRYTHCFEYVGAIEKMLGKNVVVKVAKNQLVKDLIKDLHHCRDRIIKGYLSKTRKKGVIVNDANREIRSSAEKRKILAHLLQGAESEVLKAMIEKLNTSIVLMQHDGITVDTLPDLVDLETSILRNTSYSVRLDSTKLF